jgi:hypothetical protein
MIHILYKLYLFISNLFKKPKTFNIKQNTIINHPVCIYKCTYDSHFLQLMNYFDNCKIVNLIIYNTKRKTLNQIIKNERVKYIWFDCYDNFIIVYNTKINTLPNTFIDELYNKNLIYELSQHIDTNISLEVHLDKIIIKDNQDCYYITNCINKHIVYDITQIIKNIPNSSSNLTNSRLNHNEFKHLIDNDVDIYYDNTQHEFDITDVKLDGSIAKLNMCLALLDTVDYFLLGKVFGYVLTRDGIFVYKTYFKLMEFEIFNKLNLDNLYRI